MKKLNLGNGVWKTRMPDGSSVFEFVFHEHEMARLEAEAKSLGLMVAELIRQKLLS
jgi:hypothetical protein